MKSYKFKLQRVKRVRAIEEEIARAAFAAAEFAARAAEARADERKADIARAIDDLRGLQAAPTLAPATVISSLGLVDDARRAWFDASEAARELRTKAEELRVAWQGRKRDVDGLDRLDEHARAAYFIERERDEARAIDDNASQRDARARRTNMDRIGELA
ncbi:MAG: hypothetical protein JNL28_09265 [Planctomycetes bacterium]|nr:hypothetical protein [Planctomycetota bacterium]